MLACPSCDTPPVPGARFCFQCGTPLSAYDDTTGRAERRIVTVLFGDLSDFTAWAEDLDPERVKEVTDRVLAALAQAVHDFGGHVDKLTGDGIMAVFGAPTAHEDDAERAVRAALRMQDAVRRLVAAESGGGRQLGLRVGLNTGEVLAGVQAALSYTVVGDTVNTASRLSDAAGIGGVLAGRDTALATLGCVSWRTLAPLRLKGKREPVPAYELLALRPRAADRLGFGLGDEAVLVGREAEIGALVSRLLDAAERQRPASILVTGEAGVGKTRLARELARFAGELPNSRVLWGRATPYGETRDLAPLVDMVRTACGIEDIDEPATARERVRRTVVRLEHPSASAWAQGLFADRLLGLLGLADAPEDESIVPRAAATPGDSGGSAGSSADDVVAGVTGLVQALAAQGPLVLVLDDLQWAGPQLLDTVGRVAAALTGPVLLAVVGRSDRLADAQREWAAGLPDAGTLELEPLEEPAAERLLRTYLGGSELDETAARALLDRAQGNPFFLAELLHLLVDRGLLRREAGGWRLDGELPPGVLPAGVHAVLAARIDGLDAGARAALRDAAVVGSTFWPGALDGLVAQHLTTLVERDIVRPVDDGSYAFGNMLTREVAYAGIPKAERARRHAAVVGWAAESLGGDPVDVDAFVAAQAERAAHLAGEMGLPAGDPAYAGAEAGFAALIRLAESNLSRDENRAAVDLFERAMRLAPESVAPVTFAQALANVHRLDEARAQLTAMLELADPSPRAQALVVLGDIHRKQGDEAAAIAAFAEALDVASAAGCDRVAGEAMRSLGLVDYFAGRLREAEERFRGALDIAERGEDPRGIGWALQHLAWSATTRGDYPEADVILDRAIEVFGSFGDLGGVAWSAGTEAFVRLLQGRLREARNLAEALFPLGSESGDEWGMAACLTIQALAAAELGDLTPAVARAAEAHAKYQAIGDTWGRTLALVATAAAERGLGRHDDAVRSLREAVALAEQARQPGTLTLALVGLGWTLHDGHDVDAAEAAAYRALDLAREMGLASHAEIGCRVLVALAHRARGDHDRALEILAEIAASPEQPTFLFPMRQALAHYAGTLLYAGSPVPALEVAARAVATPGEDVRSRVISLRAYGAALAANGRREEAEETLRAAVAAATETEHRLELAATEKVLAGVLTG